MMHALDEFKPDAVAIELPAESSNLIPLIDSHSIVPPIAFLYYNASNPEHSIYLPLARFSPEYQAILYCKQNQISLHCIDLPSAVSLVSSNFTDNTEDLLNKKQKSITRDPIAYLAKQDGYEDSERWWENHFEQWQDDVRLFELVNSLMAELRNQSLGRDDEETLVREQHMRIQLRGLLKKRYKKIAVICGAWHAPVLNEEFLTQTGSETIKNLRSVDVKTCIIPWTYRNLSLNNGYSAGILSPVWHEVMFEDPANAGSAFMVHAIRQLRKEGMEFSPSDAIDAGVLARNLALLRNLPSAGIEELIDSAICVFGKSDPANLEWIKEKILCGEVTGNIDLRNQQLPFVIEFHKLLKSFRLNRFWKDGEKDEFDLDLRKENHLQISRLLHFTRLLDLPWASPRSLEINALGNFHEDWKFEWHPALEIDLIHRALFGNSFQEVAFKYLQKKLSGKCEIYQIAAYLEHALKSGYQDLIPLLTGKLSAAILENADIIQLCTMIRPLMSALAYGSIHKSHSGTIRKVLDELLPKLIIEFPESVKFVDYPKSKQLLQALLVIQLYFDNSVTETADLLNLWQGQLIQIVNDDQSHPLLKGKIWSLMLERKWTELNTFHNAFQLQFSHHSDIPAAAHWFEGFLYHQTAFYLMHPEILNSLNLWLLSIDDSQFKDNLPLLRRVFEELAPGEKQRILKLISNQNELETFDEIKIWKLDEGRLLKIQSMLNRFLLSE